MDQGVALVLAAAIGAAPAIVTARALSRKVDAVHKEVKTYNEGTVGMNSAAAETRRIEEIPHDERTATEQHHVDVAPPLEPPQGPAR